MRLACQAAPICMPAIRERRGHRDSKDDPTYELEDRIQEALRGVLCGKYLNYQRAADDLNVKICYKYLSLVLSG